MRSNRIAVTLMITAALLFVLAPAASAGLIGDVVDGVGGGSGGSQGGQDSETGDSGQTSEGDGSSQPGLSDPIGDLIGGIGEGEEEAEPESGSNPGPIKKIIGGVDKAFDDTKAEVEDPIAEPEGFVEEVTTPVRKKAKGSVNKGTVTPRRTGDERPSGATTGYPIPQHEQIYNTSGTSPLENEAVKNARFTPTSSVEPSNEGGIVGEVIHQIGQIAAEAAEQAAFPIILALMVGAFLMVQNQIDRRDPKLALAPIDAEQELLSFS